MSQFTYSSAGTQADLRHRFGFHPATTEEKQLEHGSVRDALLQAALFVDHKVPPGREKSLALTHLEDAMMWANAGIARSAANPAP